ncbi:hypothetical protein GCM10011316_17450 [Roseibium aquae]|uniref:Uncharacterized protein n=1 Tax=Roseibium aquae TaxID=1323746 RepID=A0A916WZZ1_9HYPH|nr:hypothetical protein [Roseibium aquae]GGB45853.1 hypothetical protein GCM10011316_17450 [Roseibium aquae]
MSTTQQQLDQLANTVSDLGDDINDLQRSTSRDALVDADTGTHYQTAYTYFYVPKTLGGDNTSFSDDTGLGGFIRLGEYSDMEQAAYTGNTHSSYYPAQHLAAESGTGIYTNAAGGGKGILLACDGRVLVKAGEKLFINAAGEIGIESTNSTIKLKSGDNQNIDIIAGNATDNTKRGKVNITAKAYTRDVRGEEYTIVNSVSRKYYEAASYSIYHASSYKEVWSRTDTLHLGASYTYFFGFKLTTHVGASIAVLLAGAVEIAPVSKITLYGIKTDIGYWKIDFCAFKTEFKKGKIETNAISNYSSAVQVDTTATTARTEAVAAQTQATVANTNAVAAETGNVKAMIAFWEAKIASTAQV